MYSMIIYHCNTIHLVTTTHAILKCDVTYSKYYSDSLINQYNMT